MKIKLSKKQWQFIGKQAGWMKTAQHASNMTNSGTKIGHKIIIDLNGVDEDNYSIAVDISGESGETLFISQEASPEVIGNIITRLMKIYKKQDM